jgi:hypothetical protein
VRYCRAGIRKSIEIYRWDPNPMLPAGRQPISAKIDVPHLKVGKRPEEWK